MKKKKKENKSKHQNSIPSGFFVYRAIKIRNININPEIATEHVDQDLKNRLKEVVAQNKSFCEIYCNKEFWNNSFEEETCFLYLVKRKLNELHVSKSIRGKFKCKLYDGGTDATI